MSQRLPKLKPGNIAVFTFEDSDEIYCYLLIKQKNSYQWETCAWSSLNGDLLFFDVKNIHKLSGLCQIINND